MLRGALSFAAALSTLDRPQADCLYFLECEIQEMQKCVEYFDAMELFDMNKEWLTVRFLDFQFMIPFFPLAFALFHSLASARQLVLSVMSQGGEITAMPCSTDRY